METKNESILRSITDGEVLKIKALNGENQIWDAIEVFTTIDGSFCSDPMSSSVKATEEIEVDVLEIFADGTFMEIFNSLPGTWEERTLTQAQLIEFCKTLHAWLKPLLCTFFLVKKNEKKAIDETDPDRNLMVAAVLKHNGALFISYEELSNDMTWCGRFLFQVVAPKITK